MEFPESPVLRLCTSTVGGKGLVPDGGTRPRRLCSAAKKPKTQATVMLLKSEHKKGKLWHQNIKGWWSLYNDKLLIAYSRLFYLWDVLCRSHGEHKQKSRVNPQIQQNKRWSTTPWEKKFTEVGRNGGGGGAGNNGNRKPKESNQ